MEVILTLVKAGANIQTTSKKGISAFLTSAMGYSESSIDAMNYFLDMGANVNYVDQRGVSALMVASLGGKLEIVQTLIERGAQINMQNQIGETALITSVDGGNFDVVKILLSNRADKNLRTIESIGNETALDIAKRKGLSNIINLLEQSQVFFAFKKTLPPPLKEPRPAIAVPDLFGYDLSPSEISILSNKVRMYLIDTKYFKVLSLQDMKNVLEAQDFHFSERCDDTACLIQVGKMLHVEKIIGGSIGRLGRVFSLSLRMVDVESGEILHHADRDIECSLEQLLNVVEHLAYELSYEYAETLLHETKI